MKPEVKEAFEWLSAVASSEHPPQVYDERMPPIAFADDLRTLLSALDQSAQALGEAERERDSARDGMAYVLDHAVYGDSYGVHGSDFHACRFCTGGGAPGVEMVHEQDCPISQYPQVVDEWFDEMREAESRAAEAERQRDEAAARAERAEKALGEARNTLDRILGMSRMTREQFMGQGPAFACRIVERVAATAREGITASDPAAALSSSGGQPQDQPKGDSDG